MFLGTFVNFEAVWSENFKASQHISKQKTAISSENNTFLLPNYICQVARKKVSATNEKRQFVVNELSI